jgi:hypothetical protein
MDPTILAYAKSAASAMANHVQTLVGLAAKLKTQPDEAAIHMTRAIAEIGRTCQVMDDAIVSFAELIDQPSVGTLVRLQGGGLAQHVNDGRGHCHQMKVIYDRFLDRWFQRAFDVNEYLQVKNIFDVFEQGDSDLFHWMGSLALDLQQEATTLLPLVRAGRRDEVRERVWIVLAELAPVQAEMNRIVAELTTLRNELAAVTRAVAFKA